jgi:hypothetical protein
MDIHNTDPFSMSFDYASGKTGERFQNPLWQITEIFLGKQFRDSVAKVKAFGNVIVTNAVKSRQAKGPVGATVSSRDDKTFDTISGSLINSLLDSINDHQVVADAALNYLSAGENSTELYVPDPQLTDSRPRYYSASTHVDILSTYATSTSDRRNSKRD